MQWLIPILFFVVGILIKYGKAHWLVAGYHTDFEEETSEADRERLGKLVGNSFLLLGAISLAGALLRYFDQKVFSDLTWVLFIGVIIYLMLRAQRYSQPDSKLVAATSRTFLLIMLLPLLLIFALLAYGLVPVQWILGEQALILEGTYGTEVPYHQIQRIELLDEIPRVTRKVNGFNMGNVEKGVFEVAGWGEGRLYLEKKGGPYLHIIYQSEAGEAFLLLNSQNGEAVLELYEGLSTYE